jgi:hypothetical protein
MPALCGKCVKVRVIGFKGDGGGAKKGVLDGCLAHTTGKPISGEPPEIEVKPMVAGMKPVSIPIHFLELVQPYGVKDSAIIIAGEHLGEEVVVKNTSGSLWELSPSNRLGDTLTALPNHLVACFAIHHPAK